MLANLTSLGCVGPTVALRQFEHCALLAELEATVAAAVDELLELLKKKVKKQVTKVVSEMAKVPTPAAPDATSSGVAAPTGAEYVVSGEIAHADYGICGVFGEDGCETLHVLDSLCRKMVRQMRNPEARHKAHTLHHTARSFTPSVPTQEQKEGRRRS